MRTPVPHVTLTRLLLVALLGHLAWLSAAAAERQFAGTYIENDTLRVGLAPKSPEQMAAFYEARGFPHAAIDRIMQTCFVTVSVKNKSADIIWLDLDQWTFTRNGNPLPRLDAAYWSGQWEAIDLRQASRSTFGWTQLPAQRDLQPDEPVGGNLVFPADTDTLTIVARFPTGSDRKGKPITIGFGNISCGREAPHP